MTVLFIVFIASSAFQLYFWLYHLNSIFLADRRVQNRMKIQPKVSVLIAAKNEYDNIQVHLSSWLEQDYPDFEVIIIDDHSSDATKEYLQEYKDPRLKVLSLPGHFQGKKSAITFGLEQSTSDWIIVTDADCQPAGTSWISSLLTDHSNYDVILGYGPYKSTNTWLSRWITYETWYIAMQYFSAAALDRAYMGVGRNMAYRKSIFQKIGGFDRHKTIKSGDDDLFIQSLPKDANIGYALCDESWTWSKPANNLSNYIQQKRRHLTTSVHYRMSTRLWLTLIFLSHLSWYVSFIIISWHLPISIAALFIRYMIILWMAQRSKATLGKPLELWTVPIFDFLIVIFYSLFSVSYFFPRRNW